MLSSKEPTRPAPKYRRVHRRRRKSAPLWLRILNLLLAIAARADGEIIWLPCPSYKKLARCLKVSEGAISRAFKKLEEHEGCPLAFRSGYTGEGGTRQKLFALKDNLMFDCEPLFRRLDGTSRGIRESFRRGVEPVQAEDAEPEEPEPVQAEMQSVPDPLPVAAPDSAADDKGQTTQKSADEKRNGYCRFCFKEEKEDYVSSDNSGPAPAGLSGSVPERLSLLDYMRLPADYDVNLLPPPPDWWGRASPNKLAWRHAREALSDGELFWDNAKPVMPLASLQTALLPAFERGMSWEREIRPALLWALHQAHDAAVLGHVRNAGGMAVTIFRERLGLPQGSRTRQSRRVQGNRPGQKPKVFPASPPPVRPRPVAAPVDRDAVRQQFAGLAAMMREALVN